MAGRGGAGILEEQRGQSQNKEVVAREVDRREQAVSSMSMEDGAGSILWDQMFLFHQRHPYKDISIGELRTVHDLCKHVAREGITTDLCKRGAREGIAAI